jgi:quercetin dioxygenase-like cupin family protein
VTSRKQSLNMRCWNFRSVKSAPGLTASMSAARPMSASSTDVQRRRVHVTLPAVVCLVAALATSSPALAQVCKPVSQRTAELGCWIMIDAALGQLPQAPMFWHLDTYSTRADAEAAKGPRGTVVESLGRVWLFTIDAAGWRPPAGARVAEIGPLPVRPDREYSAQYMEAIFTPGMTAPSHRHSGPEAWYTVSGETCLETPDGVMVGRAGGSHVIVPGGPPMHLTATGSETRRALVLILHDSSQPATTPAEDWTPKGLCKTKV